MPRGALTGTRVRERRTLLGLKQAELARRVGVSPSYLNLIEHNRRRVGADLLAGLAAALGVEVSALAEGAAVSLVAALREAAAADPVASGDAGQQSAPVEEFIGRFPVWAALLAARHARVVGLERTVERLTDRMTHDPFLSASLHEVLSAVTSVRATAAILAETDDIDAEWRAKFHTNLHADAIRLGEGALAMVAYLDGLGAEDAGLASPQEELEAWLAARDYGVSALDADPAGDLAALIAGGRELGSRSARALAARYLARYAQDAALVPMADLQAALGSMALDPAGLARRFGVGLEVILRRLAQVPGRPAGLVVCDGSGTLTFRRPLAGFGLPRFGGACPLWPLYQVLSRPMVPLRQVVEMAGDAQSGRLPAQFLTYSLCQPVQGLEFGGPQVLEATMLILPLGGASAADRPGQAAPHLIGTSCRICPRRDCPGRREPSILTDGF